MGELTPPPPDPPPAVGHFTKFTRERCEIILAAIEEGNFLGTASAIVGIDYRTFKRWMGRGKSDLPEDAEYAAFRQGVRRARANAETKAVKQVTVSMNWRAAAWYLERSFRPRWGRVSKLKTELSGPNGTPLNVTFYIPSNGRDTAPPALDPPAAWPPGELA